MKAERTSTAVGHPPTRGTSEAGTTWTDGAAVHPGFLRFGPWGLSLVVAALFVLSFATSYAALYDYALQLDFGREFAIVFPLVLDAVISVLAVTVLLERALRRRTVTIKGWQVTLRWPTWPLGALWCYFGGSVAGNVAHAPSILAAQLVAAVPPISAALTFHLLLRLLDRAPALRMIAETYEERAVEEKERAARRRARRAQLKAQRSDRSAAAITCSPSGSGKAPNNSDGRQPELTAGAGHGSTNGRRAAATAAHNVRPRSNGRSSVEEDVLRRRVKAAVASGDRVTGENRWTVARRVRPHGTPAAVCVAGCGSIPGTSHQARSCTWMEPSATGGLMSIVAVHACRCDQGEPDEAGSASTLLDGDSRK
jgi:hypothetical protein